METRKGLEGSFMFWDELAGFSVGAFGGVTGAGLFGGVIGARSWRVGVVVAIG